MSTESNSLLVHTEKMRVPGLFHVGRLDQESEGLLLLSNDGDWANRITHPKYQIEKEYLVSLTGELSMIDFSRLTEGVELEDGLFRADSAVKMGNRRIKLVIHDGRNRVIRRVFETLGYRVDELKRVRIGSIELGKMRPGEWKELDSSSI